MGYAHGVEVGTGRGLSQGLVAINPSKHPAKQLEEVGRKWVLCDGRRVMV